MLRGFDLGANDHVLRPVDPHELRARVRNQIRRKRYQERLRDDLDRSLETGGDRPADRAAQPPLRRAGTSTGCCAAAAAAVLLLDVDRFKAVNDTLRPCRRATPCCGRWPTRLREHLRAADVVARYGGEEFLVVMAGAGEEEALAVAERLRDAIAAAPIAAPGRLLHVTVSIGVAAAAGLESGGRAAGRGGRRALPREGRRAEPRGDGDGRAGSGDPDSSGQQKRPAG